MNGFFWGLHQPYTNSCRCLLVVLWLSIFCDTWLHYLDMSLKLFCWPSRSSPNNRCLAAMSLMACLLVDDSPLAEYLFSKLGTFDSDNFSSKLQNLSYLSSTSWSFPTSLVGISFLLAILSWQNHPKGSSPGLTKKALLCSVPSMAIVGSQIELFNWCELSDSRDFLDYVDFWPPTVRWYNGLIDITRAHTRLWTYDLAQCIGRPYKNS